MAALTPPPSLEGPSVGGRPRSLPTQSLFWGFTICMFVVIVVDGQHWTLRPAAIPTATRPNRASPPHAHPRTHPRIDLGNA